MFHCGDVFAIKFDEDFCDSFPAAGASSFEDRVPFLIIRLVQLARGYEELIFVKQKNYFVSLNGMFQYFF